MARKGRPWLIDQAFAAHQYERARSAAARLIHADAGDVALISSVAYGVATAAKGLAVAGGLAGAGAAGRPLLAGAGMDDAGRRRRASPSRWCRGPATATGRRPSWPPSSGAGPPRSRSPPSPRCTGPTAASSISTGSAPRCGPRAPPCWSTPRTAPACWRMDVRTLDPDFVIFPTYKWLLGPYGRAFLYVAKRHQEKAPARADELRAALACAPSRPPTSPTRATSPTPGASTWASATTSSRWRWPRSAWR